MQEKELSVYNSTVANRNINLRLAGESRYKRRFREACLRFVGHNPAENPRFSVPVVLILGCFRWTRGA